jgi:chorismate mutase
MAVVAIRGATQVAENSGEEIRKATGELISELLVRNALPADRLISMIFTVTPELDAADPAAATRQAGLEDVPVLSTVEIAVPGALANVIRLLAHADLDRPRSAIEHVYLRGALALRPDLARAARR